MAALSLDGMEVPLSAFGTNDGLNFGRFDAPEIEVHEYQLFVSSAELAAAMSARFDALVEEMRADDLLDETPSALQRMGYPTLSDALHFANDLQEVIETFLARDILVALVPLTAHSEFVINSADEILVSDSGVTLTGRCFRRH